MEDIKKKVFIMSCYGRSYYLDREDEFECRIDRPSHTGPVLNKCGMLHNSLPRAFNEALHSSYTLMKKYIEEHKVEDPAVYVEVINYCHPDKANMVQSESKADMLYRGMDHDKDMSRIFNLHFFQGSALGWSFTHPQEKRVGVSRYRMCHTNDVSECLWDILNEYDILRSMENVMKERNNRLPPIIKITISD